MGHITSQEALVLRWTELCAEPRWQAWAGKLEINGRGVIEMSPASNRHARAQADIAFELRSQLQMGAVYTECSVLTTDGVRVPDVAWASPAFIARHADLTPFPQAPEVCVEVRSPSNTDAEMEFKTQLFLQAGAVEVWIVTEAGVCEVFDAQGRQTASQFGVRLRP